MVVENEEFTYIAGPLHPTCEVVVRLLRRGDKVIRNDTVRCALGNLSVVIETCPCADQDKSERIFDECDYLSRCIELSKED